MSREELPHPRPVAGARSAAGRAPHWRSLLEARWRARLQEVTELSLAYHGAAAAAPEKPGTPGPGPANPGPDERELLRRAVAARQRLADVEEALGRLTAGRFGRCEQCGSAIPAGLLAARPESRYCPQCDAPAIPRPDAAARPSPACR